VVIVGLAALRRVGLRGIAASRFVIDLRWLAFSGLALLAASGSLIALSMPFKYYNNVAFRYKMLLLAAALAISLVLFGTSRQQSVVTARQLALQRLLALLSLLTWIGVGVSGRLIGFL
jgi:hypothetical protein